MNSGRIVAQPRVDLRHPDRTDFHHLSPMSQSSPASRCPACGSALFRSRRNRLERQALEHRRWRCTRDGCGWVGLLQQQPSETAWPPMARVFASGMSRGLARTRLAALWRTAWGRQGLMLGAGAVVAAAVTAWMLRPAPPEAVMVGSHVVHLGTHLEGERLPKAHPLQALLPAQALETEPAGYTEAEDAALRVRRHCAWGLPGRNPYRGSAVQALHTATLSPTVARQIAADIRAGRRTDRVKITNAVIRAERSGREFDPQRVAMTYGMTMCVDTRVNFVSGHSEGADLYEAMDDDGRIYAVMVPDVCGNVSVLGQRYVRETVPTVQVAGTADPEGDKRPWMRLPPEQRIRQLPDGLRYADDAEEDQRRRRLNADGRSVSEPGTLVLGGVALAAAWLARRRRRPADKQQN
jgi:hypothetical protein